MKTIHCRQKNILLCHSFRAKSILPSPLTNNVLNMMLHATRVVIVSTEPLMSSNQVVYRLIPVRFYCQVCSLLKCAFPNYRLQNISVIGGVLSRKFFRLEKYNRILFAKDETRPLECTRTRDYTG